jgi:hypothetical protein
MKEVKLYIENREFEGEDGSTVHFKQVMIEVAGVTVPIKPVFKDDRRLLVALADRKE